jgi:hypothetical protein
MAEEKKIFMSQEVLDALFDQGKAELEGEVLTINTAIKQVYRLIPAVKFLVLAEGEFDPNNLVGKIFTKEQLKKASADIYMDSVIYKDAAYQVETGFLGLAEAEAEEKAAAEAQAAAKQKQIEEEAKKINESDKPTVAEDFNIKDLENYLLKIL